MTKISSGVKIAGVLGLAAAAAAGYYFYGKDGKANRKEANDWTKKAKAEVLAKIKQMKDVTEETYDKAVDEILTKYKDVKNVSAKELESFSQELKAHWSKISKEALKSNAKGQSKKYEVTT